MRVQPLGQEGPLEEGLATHSSILAWRIPWTEEWVPTKTCIALAGWRRRQSLHQVCYGHLFARRKMCGKAFWAEEQNMQRCDTAQLLGETPRAEP